MSAEVDRLRAQLAEARAELAQVEPVINEMTQKMLEMARQFHFTSPPPRRSPAAWHTALICTAAALVIYVAGIYVGAATGTFFGLVDFR